MGTFRQNLQRKKPRVMPLSTSRKHQMDGKEEEGGMEKVRGKGVKINAR